MQPIIRFRVGDHVSIGDQDSLFANHESGTAAEAQFNPFLHLFYGNGQVLVRSSFLHQSAPAIGRVTLAPLLDDKRILEIDFFGIGQIEVPPANDLVNRGFRPLHHVRLFGLIAHLAHRGRSGAYRATDGD